MSLLHGSVLPAEATAQALDLTPSGLVPQTGLLLPPALHATPDPAALEDPGSWCRLLCGSVRRPPG